MGKMMSGHSWSQHQRPSTARAPRVIIADDEPDVLTMVVCALRGHGYDITEAHTGAELLDQIGDGLLDGDPGARPDEIISDIRMPGLTGMEILAGIRDAHWSTAVVLMTAYADRETREDAARFGVAALFEKPFDLDDLVTVVLNITSPPPRTGKRRWH